MSFQSHPHSTRGERTGTQSTPEEERIRRADAATASSDLTGWLALQRGVEEGLRVLERWLIAIQRVLFKDQVDRDEAASRATC